MDLERAKKELKIDIDIKKLKKELLNGYIPTPLKQVNIKTSSKIRPIKIATDKDKIIQRALLYELEFIDKCLSDKSYAYRPKKSHLKAIKRVKHFINRYDYVLKSDIKDFFENIDHSILVKILKKHLKKDILNLVMLFFKNGSIEKFDYFSHNRGIHQGDVISPILSNIYLDIMDKFLEKNGFDFVRFADDFVIFAKDKESLEKLQKKLTKLLKFLKLSLNLEKTYITSIDKGFSFLGIRFKKDIQTLENERFTKIISNISKHKYLKFDKFVDYLNNYYHIINTYYRQFLSTKQKEALNKYLVDLITTKIKKSNLKKRDLKKLISKFIFLDDVDEIIDISFDVEKILQKQKRQISKKIAAISTLHIQKIGVFVGISKNKIVIKQKNKVINSYPISQIQRIVITSLSVSLSNKLLFVCVNRNIHIDFIYKNEPYCSFIKYNSASTQLIHKQALLLNTPKHFEIAKQFLKGKLKNQINYIKYLSKYHIFLDENIKKMENIYQNFKQNQKIESLMGFEGSMAVIYWDSLAKVMRIDFKRVTKGANDLVNSALNYGYAILYGEVQKSLILAGLSLHISYLHSLDKQKPTLVYDMIEEFRSFVVDRVIISMINKKEPLKIKNNLLDETSKKLIAKNIYEKLESYTIWRKKSIKVRNIIQTQAYNLANSIKEDKLYKPFIGKY